MNFGILTIIAGVVAPSTGFLTAGNIGLDLGLGLDMALLLLSTAIYVNNNRAFNLY